MTEKQYGGATGRASAKLAGPVRRNLMIKKEEKQKEEIAVETNLGHEEILGCKEAGQIAKQASDYAKTIIKPGVKLLDIAEKIEDKIMELGGKLAFPVNLSINEIAAHYTPSHDDSTLASGLLKVDIGVHVNGYIADTAFSIDLDGSEENKKLIEASHQALSKALETIKYEIEVWKIGEKIHDEITSRGFSPIRNLTGHEVKQGYLHSGISIPNYNNGNNLKLDEGIYAIEPFATNGQGIVYDSKPSGIYSFKEHKGARDRLAREVLAFIENEYETMPFCSRWLVKKFTTRALVALRLLEQAGAISQYDTLVEKGKGKVSQAEHTVLVFKDKIEVTTQG